MMKTLPQQIAVNLGCGGHYRKGWSNFDLYPAGPDVTRANFIEGVPLPDGAADFVYHSHVLEHLTRQDGERFLRECHRILKPGGVLRIAVPDLEDAAREYLRNVARCDAGEAGAEADLEWSHIELYDQIARENRDGEFGVYFSQKNVANKDYVIDRMGAMAERIFRMIDESKNAPEKSGGSKKSRRIAKLLEPSFCRERILKALLGPKEWKNLKAGRARNAGEVHKWMYDRVTLAQLLRKVGFVETKRQSATESLWDKWPHENLDLGDNGRPIHANSLYMEAVKP